MNTTIPDLPQWLRPRQVAAMTGISAATLSNLRSAGTGPAWNRSASGSITYRLADVVAYVEATRVGTLDQVAA